MTQSHFFAAAAVLLSATTAIAFQNDPVITPTLAVRGLNASSGTESSDDEFVDTTEQLDSYIRSGSTSAFGDKGSSSSGNVSLTSEISTFRIKAKGTAHGQSHISDPEGDASHASIVYFSLLFSVPVDTTFSLMGTFQIEGQGLPAQLEPFSSIDFSLQGGDPDSVPFNLAESITAADSSEPHTFFHTQKVKANTQVVMQFMAQGVAATIGTGDASVDFKFNFTIDFGDEDKDGLLDAWEIEGIDLDDDGTPEIDLPSMGADPEKKNLFVELDSQTGVNVDLNAISQVEQVFGQAPAASVENPDGSAGIILNFIVDESDLANVEYDGNGAWPAAFDTAKSTSFGTQSLRDHNDWDTIKKAYKLIFRYCIWGQTIYETRTRTDGTTYKSYYSGQSELPGNDFFVAGGVVASWFPDSTMRTNALAGTLMHEFGHALSLRHGGHEDKNYKPNYLSVMNYAYQMPKKSTTVEGTPVASVWHLDYARTAPSSLNEESLAEGSGLDGPSGRLILFNTAPDSSTPALMIADADASDIDWNLSSSTEIDPVSVDITRFSGTTDSLDSSLTAQADWGKIWYPLSGSSDFSDGSHSSSETIEPFTDDDFIEQNSYTVHDRTASACPADLNGDGIADQGDIQSFIAFFLVQDLAVDFNADGIVDLGDIQGFIVEFLAGC
ncbi:MAG: hypothetical protein ACI89L_001322 [Phycisphaerales bacterium]|jgi:hypothetical protein